MFWTVFGILAAAIVLILAVLLAFICKKMFALAVVRGEELVGSDGFEGQIADYKDFVAEGYAFYDSLPKEDVWITSFDGLKLHGTLIRNGDSKKLLIQAHGFRSSAKGSFAGSLRYFLGQGFNVLLVDHRSHGQSEGKYITYGVLERVDLRDWVYYMLEQLGEDIDIVLDGISMGATAVMMASALDLPENVRGLIADCGFTSPYDIFVEVLEHSFHAKPFPILPICGIVAEMKANFGFKDATTLDAMAENEIPILFVHGEEDDFVPIEMSEANFAACKGEKYFFRVPGAKHGCSYLVAREKCEAAMTEFFEKILQK